MRSYIERAKDFIHQVFPYIDGCMNPWYMDERIALFNETFSRKVIVRSGLSRIALITSDYVVKYDYDEDEVESIGGCANEEEMYALAEREGVAYLFAKTTRYIYNGQIFYIMPRIRGIGSGQYYAEHYMNDYEKEFCRKYKITDLHRNNYGFVKGKVCVIDYACHLDEDTSYGYDEYYDNRTSPDSWS